MPSKDDKALLELTARLHEARLIIDELGLYDIWSNIPKSSDPEFGKHGSSFTEALRQNKFPGALQKWSDNLQTTFEDQSLNYLKFKFATESGDPRYQSQQHAAKFLRRVKVLEEIVESPKVFNTYKFAKPQIQTFPPVNFTDNIISQGNRQHKFNEPDYVRLIGVLWPNRRISSPSGSVVFREGTPIDRKELRNLASIRDHSRFTDLVKGANRLVGGKRIAFTIIYPDEVLLVVKQDRL